ncbi:MAG: ATP-dependent sacrificial sulfur transferase LarE [Candidatus Saccharicenans sp.]|nr:ATP-dependent sacrificial sulfur transferase LarE [Candidatus Saccharicenans sp.]
MKNLTEKIPDSLLKKYRRLLRILKSYGSVLVALSGGVDSSLLLKAASEALGKNLLAVTVDSPIHHREEIKAARQLTGALRVRWMRVKSDDYLREEFRRNDPLRCYHCKLAVFGKLKEVAAEKGLSMVVDGSNLDDDRDYRPGHRALVELDVRSPLKEAGLRKSEIRLLARYLGLSGWNRPSNACLATRIPFGQPIEPEILGKIAEGENFLKRLGFSQVRLRHHGEVVRLEIWPEEMPAILAPNNRQKVVKRLKKLGWKYITFDLEGYRTGSLNPEGAGGLED